MKLKEIFEDALPIISNFAPSIGAAIGGPVGLAAGYIIPVLANAFNGNPANLQELAAKIATDPEAQSKLQNVEQCHGDVVCSLMQSVNSLANAEVNIKLSWK